MMSEITVMNEVFAPLVRSTMYTGKTGSADEKKEGRMATIMRHRKVKIVVLEQNEQIASECGAGDIAIVVDNAGWWVKFIGAGGEVDCYGIPYPSYNEALWAAKAAAEFGT